MMMMKMMMKMKIETFKKKFQKRIDQIQDLINEMPQKGDKVSTCQRMCLQQQLNELDSALGGTYQYDLDKTEEND